jgi:hypothetical protein
MLQTFAAVVLSVAAMVVPPMTLDELRARADVVVVGRVTHQEVHRIGGRLFTFSTLVEGQGTQLRAHLVALPGGDLDGFSQRVPGSPVLVVGGRYRLYLGKASGPAIPGTTARSRGVIGFFRGAFVVDDAGRDVPFGEDGAAPALPSLGQR